MPKKGNGRKGGKGRRVVHTRQAPTMQNMQQVDRWDLAEIIPIAVPVAADNAQPVSCQFQAGPNGWSYSIFQGGSTAPLEADAQLYGFTTGQFAELQGLWSTYRLNSVAVQVRIPQLGAGYNSPIVSAIDPAGSTLPITGDNAPAADALVALSRLRSVRIAAAQQGDQRRVDYSSWLTQTCPQPYLLTVDPQSSSQERVVYPSEDLGTTPVSRFLWNAQTNTGAPASVIALVHVRASITVRGRRGVQLSIPNTIQPSITSAQLKEYKMLKALYAEEPQPKREQ